MFTVFAALVCSRGALNTSVSSWRSPALTSACPHDVGAARREAFWRCNLRARCDLPRALPADGLPTDGQDDVGEAEAAVASDEGQGGGGGAEDRLTRRLVGAYGVRRRAHSRRPGRAGAVLLVAPPLARGGRG